MKLNGSLSKQKVHTDKTNSLFDYKLSQADFDSNVNVEQGKNDYTDGRSSRKTFTD